MAFSKQQLHKFADLIKIDISDEKLEKMNIDSVVEWLDKLQKLLQFLIILALATPTTPPAYVPEVVTILPLMLKLSIVAPSVYPKSPTRFAELLMYSPETVWLLPSKCPPKQ